MVPYLYKMSHSIKLMFLVREISSRERQYENVYTIWYLWHFPFQKLIKKNSKTKKKKKKGDKKYKWFKKDTVKIFKDLRHIFFLYINVTLPPTSPVPLHSYINMLKHLVQQLF
jgi:hypothetical protein